MRWPGEPWTAGDVPPDGDLAWNVLVTCREGTRRRVRQALHRLVRLRSGGYRNVMIGQVDDLDAFLAGVAGLCEHRPALGHWLGKILPIERTFAVDAPSFDERLRAEAAPVLDRLAGRSFHVRVERRGHKGRINTHAAERALGEYLYEALRQRGEHPVVRFRDPDAVVAVEVLGNVAGLGLVTRELRERWPFVKID